MSTKILVKLEFKEYQLSRCKPSTKTSAVIYTKKSWIDREVCIIPMKLDITDRYIESQFNPETETYTMTVETDTILRKTIKNRQNIGRTYLPTELIGIDMLIIPKPVIENLY